MGFLLPSSSWLLKLSNEQFKRLRRLLQRDRHIEIELKLALCYVFCDYSMLVTLFKVGEVYFRFLGTKVFSCSKE